MQINLKRESVFVDPDDELASMKKVTQHPEPHLRRCQSVKVFQQPISGHADGKVF